MNSTSSRRSVLCNCPRCGRQIETLIPGPGETGKEGYWRFVGSCVNCRGPIVRRVWPNGNVEIDMLPAVVQ